MSRDDAFKRRFEAELAKSDQTADPKLARLGAFARALEIETIDTPGRPILYDESCLSLADLFLRDALPLEMLSSDAAIKREAHYLAQVIQQAIEDHLAERDADDWRVDDNTRRRWGVPK